MTAPVLNIHAVDPSGAISLTAANVPYSNLQWNRSRSAPGTFAALIACPLPVAWPGRYLVTLDGRDEVGVLEKVEAEDDGTPPTLSGRFAESLWARYRLGAGGRTIAGANWRQAATEALCAWHMGDLPSLALSDGCERATGTGYSITGAAGASASDLIYQCANGNSAHHLITYDRDANPGSLIVRIVDERDLTTGQSALPWKVFGLQLGSALSASYSGDYSTACSVVIAHADDTTGEGSGVTVNVPVPSFDPSAQWEQSAYEDVASLIDSGASPTTRLVTEAGRLRAQDHEAALEVDCSAISAGYRTDWDLGDLCEAEIISLGLTAVERIEEVRETIKPEGETLDVTLGTKYLSRISRAIISNR